MRFRKFRPRFGGFRRRFNTFRSSRSFRFMGITVPVLFLILAGLYFLIPGVKNFVNGIFKKK
ncbi:MAG: hypothetical protein QM791_02920 [Ferruginibacter sp.]